MARVWTPAKVAELEALYAAGLPLRAIAARLGTTFLGVDAALKRYGVDRGRYDTTRPPPVATPGLTAADDLWMAYWRQPPAVRLQQRIAMEEARS